MDSDEEEDVCIDDTDRMLSTFAYSGGKLNDILAEVETKIPSLDFDEEVDDGRDGPGVPSYNDEEMGACYRYDDSNASSAPINDAGPAQDEESTTLPLDSPQLVEPAKVFHPGESGCSSTPTSVNISAEDGYFQLDFDKLNEINFHAVESALCCFGSAEESTFRFDTTCCEERRFESCDENELMVRLSNLSKDQLNACCAMENMGTKAEVPPYSPYPDREQYSGNSVSPRAIHSWSQLKNGDSTSQKKKTVFLDLRPLVTAEDEMAAKRHSTSIQRILGLLDQRSGMSSDDDSDDELKDWHEMRNRHKERVTKQAETFEKKSLEKGGAKQSIIGVKRDHAVQKEPQEQVMFGDEDSANAVSVQPQSKSEKAIRRNMAPSNDPDSVLEEEEMLQQPEIKVTSFAAEDTCNQKKKLTPRLFFRKRINDGQTNRLVSVSVLRGCRNCEKTVCSGRPAMCSRETASKGTDGVMIEGGKRKAFSCSLASNCPHSENNFVKNFRNETSDPDAVSEDKDFGKSRHVSSRRRAETNHSKDNDKLTERNGDFKTSVIVDSKRVCAAVKGVEKMEADKNAGGCEPESLVMKNSYQPYQHPDPGDDVSTVEEEFVVGPGENQQDMLVSGGKSMESDIEKESETCRKTSAGNGVCAAVTNAVQAESDKDLEQNPISRRNVETCDSDVSAEVNSDSQETLLAEAKLKIVGMQKISSALNEEKISSVNRRETITVPNSEAGFIARTRGATRGKRGNKPPPDERNRLSEEKSRKDEFEVVVMYSSQDESNATTIDEEMRKNECVACGSGNNTSNNDREITQFSSVEEEKQLFRVRDFNQDRYTVKERCKVNHDTPTERGRARVQPATERDCRKPFAKLRLDKVTSAVMHKTGLCRTVKETEEVGMLRRTATVEAMNIEEKAPGDKEPVVATETDEVSATTDASFCIVREATGQIEEEKATQSAQSFYRDDKPRKNDCLGKQRNDSTTYLNSKTRLKPRTFKERKQLKEKVRTQIENMRLNVSSNGKYPAAFNTPIIYDKEASYEPDCRSLWPVAEDQMTLLLVATLLGCGEINAQRCKGKAPDSAAEVNFYFALLAWLLSLGGLYDTDRDVPFSIIAMQQAYQHGKLQLFVGVQPNQDVFDVDALSEKVSRKNRIKSFHKVISRYLSTHSLRNVYQNMGKVYLGGSYPLDESAFSSRMLSTCITVGQDPDAVKRVFESRPGFFWETLETADTNEVFQRNSCHDFTPENTIILVQERLYHRPACILDLLSRIEDEGCDLAGLRLAYHEISKVSDVTVARAHSEHEVAEATELPPPLGTLALAVRGPCAISKLKNIIGSKIPIVDDGRDVPSLRSLYCSTVAEDKLFYCPSYSNQAAIKLARWFGGRVAEEELANEEESQRRITLNVGSPLSDGVPVQKPPALLVSCTQTALYLLASPLVPPRFLGHLLRICSVRGFSIHGIRRMHLSKRLGGNLGFSQSQQAAFCCPSSTKTPFQSPSQSPPESPTKPKATFNFDSTTLVSSTSRIVYPATVILLQKENGIYHTASLVKHLSKSLDEWSKNNPNYFPIVKEKSWRLYFYFLPFNDANCKYLWGDVCSNPDASMLKLARVHCFPSNPEVEEACVLCAVSENAVQYVGVLLRFLYSYENPVAGNWELLGLKSFSSLSLVQAREVTPVKIGEQSWESSIKRLMSTAVFACVLRGVNIIQRLRQFMTVLHTARRIPEPVLLNWWMSQTADVAFRQIVVLFQEDELFCDESARSNLRYTPAHRQKVSCRLKSSSAKVDVHKKRRSRHQRRVECKNSITDESSTSAETIQFCELPIIQSLSAGPRPITTLALIKPSCVLNNKKFGKILKSICQENFDIVALRMSVLTRNEADVLVNSGEEDVDECIKYLTSSASLLMCLQRENAVKKLLDILGPSDPVIARSLDPFLLRGSYGVDSIHNAMHGSESYCAAMCEIKILFPCGLCADQTTDLEAEQIPCRAYDGTIGKSAERKLAKRVTEQAELTQSLVISLVQVNCLVLTHNIVYARCGRRRIALVEVLESLFSSNFIPVAMKMALLSEEQAEHCFKWVRSNHERRQKLKNELTEGPCIVIALQRDNAVTCFDTIFESAQAKCSSLSKYREHILQGHTEEDARNLLLYFFDGLAPNCALEIISA